MGKKFRKLIQKKREEYRSWESVYSPALGEHIFFTMHGFNHLRFRKGNVTRNLKEFKQRLSLLTHVRHALRNARDVTGYRQRVSVNDTSGKVTETEYWAIEAIVGREGNTIRVVLRRTKGMKHIQFLSVMERK